MSEPSPKDTDSETCSICSTAPPRLPPQPTLTGRFYDSIGQTVKTDKYVRLVCNFLKIVRACSA